ncbi:hypothetical protein [Halolactibacillus sp. JCM 19043]|uniref:hypothetical protein n=1 Tax=Halolactibacillus sp. JCM 19043 TaxID=1460638 RepID=UPI0018D1CFD1|nr:hypothetical protein [Halolactibacillus sp. JCM 19043]
MGEMIVIILIGMCSFGCFVISVLQFIQKGWLFNNAIYMLLKKRRGQWIRRLIIDSQLLYLPY